MPRLFWKLFLALWLSIIGFSALTAWVSERIVAQRMTAEAPGPGRMASERRALGERIEGAILRDGERGAQRALRRLPPGARNHVFVVDDGGREALGRENGLERLRRGGFLLPPRPVAGPDGRQWTVLVAERLPRRALLAPGPRGMLLRLALSAVVAALVSFFLARHLTSPLRRLGEASRAIRDGDLAARVGAPVVARRDEFGQLARDFDAMAGRLEEMQGASQRLLRDVSHELRSPLARQRVAVELARGRQPGDVSAELDRVELESERLEALVGEVLDLLRARSGARPLAIERFDLAELLAELAASADYEAGADAGGVRVVAPEGLWVEGDRELLWRAVENLLRNALHHGGGAGVELHAAAPDAAGRVTLRVLDAGPGVPADRLAHLFDPFYRVDDARGAGSGGYGLGLAIAAAAVQRHGGDIIALNREGGGLEVRIGLPAQAVA